MYRTSNVARLAGAVSLPVFLAGWGLAFSLVAGETTVSTWALGLASMFPVSALLVVAAGSRSSSRPRTGFQYAVGLVASVVAFSTAFLGAVAVADYAAVGALAGLGALELAGVGTAFALFLVILVLVDARYVERPVTAAMLEDRYLDDPVRDD
jgi:hypothetical protein